MLLAIETKETQLPFINDNTVEGAVVLMEKIGYMIDEKLNSAKAETVEDSKQRQTEGDNKDKMINTFARFEEVASDDGVPKLSTRVKMLIKNMLENRAKGWEKTKK